MEAQIQLNLKITERTNLSSAGVPKLPKGDETSMFEYEKVRVKKCMLHKHRIPISYS